MYKNFNLYTFISWLIPPILRKRVIKAFIDALIKPLNDLLIRLKIFALDVEMRLNHNAFTVYLEKFLNTIMNADGKIYIKDVVENHVIYLSNVGEHPEMIYMSMKSELLNTVFVPSSLPGALIGKFAICIPVSMDTPENRQIITRWCNYYKYAGTKFIIETY